MARAGLTIRAELNSTLTQEMLDRVAGRLENRHHLLEEVAREARKWEHEVIESQGAAGAKKRWAPLAPGTVALKGSGRPLKRTGALLSAILGEPKLTSASATIRGPEYALMLASGRRTANSKAGSGGRTGWKGLGGSMPHRNVMPLPPRQRVAEVIAHLVDGILAGAR